jgi:hypothetical protein
MTTKTLGEIFHGMHILEETPATLRAILANATAENLQWQPRSDRWSISMVLAHLAEVEERAFASRFHAIAEQDNPVLPAYDQLALFRSGATFDGRAELDQFERRRAESLAWLSHLPYSVLERFGQHAELGPLSFGQLLNEFAFHDLGHIRQVIELYRSQAFYPNMGVFRDYYAVNP